MLKILNNNFSICKVGELPNINLFGDIFFVGKTDEEISIVCNSEYVPTDFITRDDGWRAFRIEGVLDFSLVGILAKISNILAENNISIFALSTYNTDYILIKEERFDDAIKVLRANGYEIAH